MVKQFAFALGITTCLVNVDLAHSKASPSFFTDAREGVHSLQRRGSSLKATNPNQWLTPNPEALTRLKTKNPMNTLFGERKLRNLSSFRLTKKVPFSFKNNRLSARKPITPSIFKLPNKGPFSFKNNRLNPGIAPTARPFSFRAGAPFTKRMPVFIAPERPIQLWKKRAVSLPLFWKPRVVTKDPVHFQPFFTRPSVKFNKPALWREPTWRAHTSLKELIAIIEAPTPAVVRTPMSSSLSKLVLALTSPSQAKVKSVVQEAAPMNLASPSLREEDHRSSALTPQKSLISKAFHSSRDEHLETSPSDEMGSGSGLLNVIAPALNGEINGTPEHPIRLQEDQRRDHEDEGQLEGEQTNERLVQPLLVEEQGERGQVGNEVLVQQRLEDEEQLDHEPVNVLLAQPLLVEEQDERGQVGNEALVQQRLEDEERLDHEPVNVLLVQQPLLEEQGAGEQVGNEGLVQQRLEDEDRIERERIENERRENAELVADFVVVENNAPGQLLPVIIDNYLPLPQEGQQPLPVVHQQPQERIGLLGFGGVLGFL